MISIITVTSIVFSVDEVSQLLMSYCQIKDCRKKETKTILNVFIALFLRMKQSVIFTLGNVKIY